MKKVKFRERLISAGLVVVIFFFNRGVEVKGGSPVDDFVFDRLNMAINKAAVNRIFVIPLRYLLDGVENPSFAGVVII